MDINNLKAFIAVADKRSFSRSAESLHLTQPAVSKRIAALETELSARLFDRVGRQVHLTEAGQVLLPSARQISSELERIEELISNLGKDVSGRLCIGVTNYVAIYRLPEVLKQFKAAYPLVELDLHFSDSATTLQGVADGQLEMALCAVEDEIEPKLRSINIWQDKLTPVVSIDHPLANEPSISLDVLLQCPAILPSEPSVTRSLISRTLAQLKKKPVFLLEASQLETLKMMVSIGLGWSCLPRSMLDETVTELNIPELHLTRQLSLIRHRERTLTRAAQAFLDQLPV